MQHAQHKSYSVMPVLLLGLFFATIGLSCGGGGGGTPPPPANEDASGLYDGSGTVAFANVQAKANLSLSDMKGIIHAGRFMFFNLDAANFVKGVQDYNVLIDGKISSITKNSLVGTADVYQAGQIVSKNVPVTGTVTGGSQISLTLAATTAEAGAPAGDFLGGSVQGTFNSQYNNTASSTIIDTVLNKEWGASPIPYLYMIFPNMKAALTVSTTTVTTYKNVGRNSNSSVICQFDGKKVTIPNNKINIYELVEGQVVSDISCVGIIGSQANTGLASVLTTTNTNDTLWYAVANGTYSVYALLDRVP